MNRLTPLMLLACLAAATAHAQNDPAPVADTAQDAAASRDATAHEGAAQADARDEKRASNTHCLRETGTRIAPRDGKGRCLPHAGRSYSKDDLDRTGEINLADALRRLDPAVR